MPTRFNEETLSYHREMDIRVVAGSLASCGSPVDVYLPRETDLFLDLDSASSQTKFLEMKAFIERSHSPLVIVYWGQSRHNGHHVIVRLDHHITPLERITFQAVLGSDPRREALALIDYMTPSIHPLTCFFEKPGTVIPGYEKETL